MTDIEIAKSNLSGHTIALCKDRNLLLSEKRGIAPMMGFIDEGRNLKGYSVADLVVGKAAAMLFVKAGICEVYAENLSEKGKEFLQEHGVKVTYKNISENIINRQGTDICPMEKTVLDCGDTEQGYLLLKDKLLSMKK